MITTSVVNIQV